MNIKYRNAFIKEMITHKDFIPARDEAGSRLIDEDRSLLIKNSYKNYTLAEFIDGDKLDCEQISSKLSQGELFLTGLKQKGAQFFYEVFVFETSPDKEKLSSIIEGQFKDNRENKHLNCITIDMSTQRVEAHFNTSKAERDLIKLLEKVIADNKQEEVSTQEIEELAVNKEKEYQFEAAGSTPVVTYTIIAINMLVYALFYVYSIKSGKDYSELIYNYGAKVNVKILGGEFYRFITPIFLHANLTHLLVNCYSLYAVGVSVERIFGRRRFLAVYFIAGILGNVASFVFSQSWGIGASGAIFGLLGALLYFGLMKPTLFKMFFGNNILIMIVINLSYGFSVTGIDNYAHIGGLIGGFLATGIVAKVEKSKWYFNKVLYIALTIIIMVSGVTYGFHTDQNRALIKINMLDKYDKAKDWNNVITTAKEILSLKQSNTSTKVSVLWTLVKAEAYRGKYEDAVLHAKTMEQLDAGNGHYILGLLYYDMKQYDLSKQKLLEAKKAGMKYEAIDRVLSYMK